MSLFSGGDSSQLDVVVKLQDEASAGIKNLQQSFGDLSNSMAGMGTVAAEAAVAVGVIDAAFISVGKSVLDVSAQFEQLQVGFKTLLGSGNAATEFMNQLKDFAAKTPFEVPALADMSRQLLSVGVSAKDVIPDLRAIGDAASAMGKGQQGALDITHALVVMEARGKLSEREIMMLSYNGINGLQLLSEQTGKTTKELTEMITKGMINGKVAAELFMKAFENKWGDGMAMQSQTVNGLMTTLRDNLRFAALALGDMFLPAIRDFIKLAIEVIQKVTEWLKQHQELVKIIAITVASILALITVAVTVGGTIVAVASFVGALGVALGITTAAAWGLMASMGVWIALVAAVIGTMVWLSDRFGGLGEAMKALGIMADEVANAIAGAFQWVGNKIAGVIDTIYNGAVAGINKVIQLADKLGAHMSQITSHADLKVDTSGFDQMQKDIDKLDQMQADAILKKSDAEQHAAQESAKVTQAIKLSTAAQKENLAALTEGMKGTAAAGKSADTLKTKLDALTDSYTKVQQTAKDELSKLGDAHTKYMDAAAAKTADLKQQLLELTAAYNQGSTNDNQSIAEKAVNQEQKIADLKEQISNETNSKRLTELNETLSKEQKAYNDNIEYVKSLGQAYADAEARGKLTQFEKEIEDYKKKRAQADKEYQDKKTDLQAKLDLETKNAADELKTYNDKVTAINALLKQANETQLADLKGTAKAKIAVINQEIEAYNALAAAISRAGAGKASLISGPSYPTHEFGGIVQGAEGTPQVILAHGGERVIPARQTATMKNGSGDVIITINNPVVRNDDDLKKLDKMFRDLALNYKFRN